LWNDADEADPFTGAFWGLLRDSATEPEVVREPHHFAGRALLSHPLFEGGEQIEYSNSQVLDESGMMARARSASFAPREGSAEQTFSERLRSMFARHQQGGIVTLQYRSILYLALRRE
jgi:hypothetical protein